MKIIYSQNVSPHIIHPNWLVPAFLLVVYLVVVQQTNVHWFRITKPFGYCLTSIFSGAQRFATPFIRQAMSAEELRDIVRLLYTLYIVLVPIQITTNSINTPNLLVSEACINGIYRAVLVLFSFFLDHRLPIHPMS